MFFISYKRNSGRPTKYKQTLTHTIPLNRHDFPTEKNDLVGNMNDTIISISKYLCRREHNAYACHHVHVFFFK